MSLFGNFIKCEKSCEVIFYPILEEFVDLIDDIKDHFDNTETLNIVNKIEALDVKDNVSKAKQIKLTKVESSTSLSFWSSL